MLLYVSYDISKILGFSTEGSPILPRTHFSNDIDVIRREKLGWDEISKKSAKIVSFIGKKVIYISAFKISFRTNADLAGHKRYLKTTLYGTKPSVFRLQQNNKTSQVSPLGLLLWYC